MTGVQTCALPIFSSFAGVAPLETWDVPARLAGIPRRESGLGIYRYELRAMHAYAASCDEALYSGVGPAPVAERTRMVTMYMGMAAALKQEGPLVKQHMEARKAKGSNAWLFAAQVLFPAADFAAELRHAMLLSDPSAPLLMACSGCRCEPMAPLEFELHAPGCAP